MCAQRRASRIKRGRTVTDSHKQHTCCVFVLSLTQDLRVLCLSDAEEANTPRIWRLCVHLFLSPPLLRPPSPPSQVHQHPSSEPEPDRWKRKHRHDTKASTRHQEKVRDGEGTSF